MSVYLERVHGGPNHAANTRDPKGSRTGAGSRARQHPASSPQTGQHRGGDIHNFTFQICHFKFEIGNMKCEIENAVTSTSGEPKDNSAQNSECKSIGVQSYNSIGF